MHKLYLWSTARSKKGRFHLQPALCCNAYQDNLQELHLAIPSPTTSEPPASFRGCQRQVGDRSASLIAACRAQHISQPLCTQASSLFYQPARRLVPAPARTSQLEAQGCDKAGLGDGGRDGKYWGGELIGSSTGRSGFIAVVWDVEGLAHRRKGPALICAAAHRTAHFMGNV